jgi:hypothetical protein
VEIRAESLDWLPATLAALDLPFVIERPAELRDRVVALARRLADSGRAPSFTRRQSLLWDHDLRTAGD